MLFMNRKNRDKEYRKLIKQGRFVYRAVSKGQLIHPMYIVDYELETGNRLTLEQKGFGNTIYKTYFKTIYKIEDMIRY